MNIIVGITGSIAAYKIPELIRLLIKDNFNVKTVVTKNGLEFITKTTIETVSRNEVYFELFKNTDLNPLHISLSKWADCILVAPATANIISKYTVGICDDLLSTLLLEFDKKIIFAPAMNEKMWLSWQIQRNIKEIKKNKAFLIGPIKGVLACQDEGLGRMTAPEEIFQEVKKILKK